MNMNHKKIVDRVKKLENAYAALRKELNRTFKENDNLRIRVNLVTNK